MPIVNTVAVRLEAFEAGFRAGIDATNRKLSAFEKQLGNTADSFARVHGRAANFADGMRSLRKPIQEPQSFLDRLTNGVKRFGETTQAGRTPLANFIQQNRNLGDVAQNAVRFIAGLNPAMAAVVAVAGVAAVAVGRLVREVTQLGEQLLVTSERTGRSVEDLSGLRVAAELSNTNLQDVQVSIRFLNRLLANAARGSDAAAKRFEALGVEFRNTEGKVKPLSQLMGEIGDRLSQVEDASERAGKAQLVYGFNAARAIPLFGQSAEAQARLTAEAKAFGGFISEDFARQADRFTDNTARMGFILEGLKIQIGGPIIEVLNKLTEGFLKAFLGAKVFAAGLDQARLQAELFIARLTGQGDVIEVVEAKLKKSQEEVRGLAGAWSNLGEQVEKGAVGLDDAGESLDAAAQAAEELKAKLDPLETRFASVFESISGQPEEAGAKFVALGEKIAALGGAKARAGLQTLINQLSDIPGVGLENTVKKLRELQSSVTALSTLNVQFARMQEGLEGGADAAIGFANNLLKIGSPKALAQYDALIVRLTKLAAAGDKAAERAARALIAAEGPPVSAEQRAERERFGFEPATRGAVGAEAQLQVGPAPPTEEALAARAVEREAAEFVGPPTLDEAGLMAVSTAVGDINVQFEEQAELITGLNTLAGGFGDALIATASGAKGAFGDFFKGLLAQFAKAIAQAAILSVLLNAFGFGGAAGGFKGLFKKGLGFDDPGADAFALAEGRRFGMLFGRGARVGSESNQLGLAGNALATSPTVVVRPEARIFEPGPLTRIEWFERGQEQRLRRRQNELGGEPL